MKWTIAGCAAVALLLSLNMPASATVIFSDDFNRADNTTVGNGWVETNANAADVQVIGNELELGKNQTPQATQGTTALVTTGFINILLDYDWRGIGTETGDTITVYWSDDNTTYNLLATHDLGSPTVFAHNQVSLPSAAENNNDIWIRFQLNADQGNDFGRIDSVVLSGLVQQHDVGVPEPGTLAVFGLGVAGLGFMARRRAARRVRA